ncbi:MAG TPA: hypothetical protein VGC63_10395 [Solirubrobacterales bacterium]|jgi:hypothetical protein
MPCRRLCFRTLVLAILGLATIGVTIASAAESPHWAIEGNTLKELKLTSETVTGNLKSETTAKISVPKLSLTLICKTVTISESKLEREGASAVTLPFSKCSWEKVESCTVDNFTVSAKGRLVLHAETVYEVFEALKEGASLAEILSLGKECTVSPKALLTGSIAAPIGSQALVEQPLTTITSESTLKLIGAPELKFGTNPATLSASLVASLSGGNKGEAWGASLDAGTALCKAELEHCSTVTTFSPTTELKGSLSTGAEAVIETGLGAVGCTKSSIKGNALGKESEVLRGEVSSLTFESCKSGAKACTVTSEKLPYTGELTYAEDGDGTVDFAALKAASIINIVCEGIVNCTFGGASKLDLEGGEPAVILASEESLSVTSGSLCPKEAAALTAAYELTAPSVPAFVAVVGALPTKLCKEPPGLNMTTNRLECPAGQEYSGEIRTNGTSSTEFKEMAFPTEVINCNETEIVGSFEEDGAPTPGNGITFFSYKSEAGPCTSTLFGGTPAAAATMMNLNYTSSAIGYSSRKAPEGVLGIGGQVGSSVELRIQVGMATCDYVRADFVGKITNAFGLLEITGTWLNRPREPACPFGFFQTTTVKIGRPNPTPGQPDLRVFVASE